ncbi:MAG: hypothetical protein JRJ57_10875 [Deltaproteobacteria bacterium]|nr:hypothetical protein [Deltaproteobacteria bacterium]
MKNIETIIGILMAVTASVGLFNYYKRKLLIKNLTEADSKLGIDRNHEFTFFFKERESEAKVIKKLRMEVNISTILIFCFFLVMMILATQI